MPRRSATATRPAGFDTAGWFFDNSLDVLLVLRDRVVERVNPAWTALTKWSAAETIGRNMDDLGHPENLAAIRAATTQAAAHGFAETEIRIRTKDDRWLWMSCRARFNDDGLVMAVLRDVTEERQRAAAEEQAKAATDLLHEIAGVTIWRFDPERRLYFVDEHLNPAGEVGVAGSRVLKTKEMTDEIHPEDGPRLWEGFVHTLKTGETRVVEYRHLQAPGEWGHMKLTMRGLRQLPSGKWEVLGMTQDVTELATARDSAIQGELIAKDAAESKSQFLANISHEIRTPLNGVVGVLHLLKDESLTPDGRALLTEALGCGSMLAELLNDVLDFSKIDAGCLELQDEPVDVAALIEGVSSIMRPQLETKGLDFSVDIEPLVGWVRTDPVRLRQILFNLVGNAVKFTPAGAVSIRLRSAGKGGRRRLRFEVEDTGIGVSQETRGRLFTRFYQADGSTTRGYGGTGLGLVITRRLAELMGGEVGVESREGEGSVFWIDLPAPEIAAPEKTETLDGAWLAGLKILVVEDNATNRLIVTRILENLGAAVETAANGALGVEAVKRAGFDLVFMDVQMPVLDGVAATAAIRALSGPARETPIIAMTANVMTHQLTAYRQAGMNGAVSKPLSPAAIIVEIARLANGADEAEPQAADAA